MYETKNTITKASQFINEALLVYFLIIPIYYFFKLPIIFTSYLLYVALATILFAIGTRMTDTYLPFIIITPILALVGYFVLNISIFFTCLFALLFCWRFINQLKEEKKESEGIILGYSTFLAIVEAIVFSSDQVTWMAIILFVFLIASYLLKQYVNMEGNAHNSQQQRSSKTKGTLIVIAIPIAIAGVIYLVFDYIYALFGFILFLLKKLLLIIATIVIEFLEWTGLDMSPIRDFISSVASDAFNELSKRTKNNMEYYRSEEGQTSWAEEHLDEVLNTTLWIGIGIAIIVAIIVSIVFYKRNVNSVASEANTGMLVHTKNTSQNGKRSGSKLFGMLSRKPENPARQIFFEFEQYAAKKGFGRDYSETIEEWFERVDFPAADVWLYQKARYGEQNLTKEELKIFKEKINNLREQLKDQSKKTNQ